MDTSKIGRLDWMMFTFYLALVGLGLLMIFSASSLEADAKYGNGFRFVIRQGAGISLGLALSSVILVTPMKWLRRAVLPGFIVVLLSQLMILTPLAHTANGATRWFRLGPVNVQPSEFMKFMLVLALSHYLAINRGRMQDLAIILTSAVFVVLPLVFMFPQSDFGTTVILMGLGGVLLFVAGLPWKHVLGLGGLSAFGLGGLIAIEPYRIVRLMSFLDPFKDASDSGYQVVQGWIAMATGGLFGQGLAGGVAQRGFLPEPHTDFISAVVAEELGAVGWLVMVLLFAGLIWRALWVAHRSKDVFCLLVTVGMASLLAAQIIINLGVVGGLMPNKGLVLPFMSYGASAVMAHTVVVGVLLRMSMEAEPAPETSAAAGTADRRFA